MNFDSDSVIPPGAKIKVIGVGGGGGNAVNTMIKDNLEGVDFISANTDIQALRFSLAPVKIQLGRELTKGLGAGADPDIGRDAALEDRHAIQEAIGDSDMVFITAGMGGGTGTGGASVVAQIAREMGALTVGVVTKPFMFEGKRRRKQADCGIDRLRESVDTLITIPNQRLLQVASPDLSMMDAFQLADNVLLNAVRGISDIINIPGTVNVDFADVKTVMSCMGMALMGIGKASGEQRAVEAARQAISSPLLEDVDIEGATGILINITAGSAVTLMEINESCSIIQDAAHEDANIIFGAVIDEEFGDEIRVTVIATGFPHDESLEAPEKPSNRPQHALYRRQQPIITERKLTTPPPRAETKETVPTPAPIIEAPILAKEVPTQQAPEANELKLEDTLKEFLTEQPEIKIDEEPLEVLSDQSLAEPDQEIESLTEATMAGKDLSSSPFDLDQELGGLELRNDPPLAESTPVEEVAPIEVAPRVEGAKLAEEIPKPVTLGDSEEREFVLEDEMDLPMEALFDNAPEGDFTHEYYEEKLDEALKAAERLKEESEKLAQNEEGDNLDVPAFLRNGMKDLSLD